MTAPSSKSRRSPRSYAPPPSGARDARPLARRALWLAIALAAGPNEVLADTKADFEAHVVNATLAYKDGRFDEALVDLEAAYALDPQPDLLYAIGQVHAKLGNCEDATASFRRFEAAKRSRRTTGIVEQAIAACKPGPRPPEPSISAHDTATPLVAEPSQLVAALAPLPQAPALVVTRPQPRSPWYEDKLGDALVLGGLAAAAVGLIEYRSAVSDLDAAEQATTLARYRALVDDAHDERTTSLVLVGAGGALVGAGIVRYALRGGTAEPRGIALAPAYAGGLVTYGGRF